MDDYDPEELKEAIIRIVALGIMLRITSAGLIPVDPHTMHLGRGTTIIIVNPGHDFRRKRFPEADQRRFQ